MKRTLPCALVLLFLLGRTAGDSAGGTCRLGPYGAPLPDDPLQCPGHLDGSAESSLDGAQGSPQSPGKACAGAPPAKETGLTWTSISGVSAEEGSRSPTGPKSAGIFLMDGDLCHRWVFGQGDPIETFQCPTQRNHRDDLFCCGTCTISYCCSSQKDRLEQESCPKIMEEIGDQGTGESTGPPSGPPPGPPPEKPATISNIGIILVLTAVMGLCIWISYICLQFRNRDRGIIHNDQRAGNEQQEEIIELLPTSAGGPPASSQAPEESERSSELPPAVVSPPGGAGSPMDEEISPAVPPEGNLEPPPEEEETAL